MFGLAHIESVFQATRADGRAALMPYLTLGYPQRSLEVIEAAVRGGADMLELGMPFSDPLADGPTIQRSTQAALQNGMTIAGCIADVAELRSRGVTLPVFLMGYCNPLLNYGLERFVKDASRAGVDGFIIPDLPLEEAAELAVYCRLYERALVYLVSPNTPEERLKCLAQETGGFLYMVSVTGVTGARQSLADNLGEFAARVRRLTAKPLAVGFGIATPQQAAVVGKLADGVIVGSAIIQVIDAHPGDPERAVEEFVSDLARAVGVG
ncbi:MAG: tryptophan synthase subunit alpha [Chloroflexi bacterium HGW-Chloroflexi-10]|nr:MAG: tryptophan synthase subunit alpha [Chloroflexi bacterium HGW-Chloroflexi-10]